MAGKQGFASMTMKRVREIASQGGKAAHRKGVAHRWTSEQARLAGRKGGKAGASGRSGFGALARAQRQAVGRKGGLEAARRRRVGQ